MYSLFGFEVEQKDNVITFKFLRKCQHFRVSVDHWKENSDLPTAILISFILTEFKKLDCGHCWKLEILVFHLTNVNV